MTQIFDEAGTVCPVTVVSLEPMTVSGKRVPERDGYAAIQAQAYGAKREFRTTASHAVGDTVPCSFTTGDVVRVSAVSKGKGFQGVVKRYGFSGGPRTHGQKHNERQIGSIGSGFNRVLKGKKMPGRMGGKRVTSSGVRVVGFNEQQGVLLLRGSIPGRRGALVEIRGV